MAEVKGYQLESGCAQDSKLYLTKKRAELTNNLKGQHSALEFRYEQDELTEGMLLFEQKNEPFNST
jgi:hypothetical protein